MRLPARITSPRLARAELDRLHERETGTGRPTSTARWDDARLAVSELVTNAVQHAGTEIDLTLDLLDDELVVCVSDGSPDGPMPRKGFDASGGAGLRLVASVSDQWGICFRRHSKTVWCRVLLGEPNRRRSGGDHAAGMSPNDGSALAKDRHEEV